MDSNNTDNSGNSATTEIVLDNNDETTGAKSDSENTDMEKTDNSDEQKEPEILDEDHVGIYIEETGESCDDLHDNDADDKDGEGDDEPIEGHTNGVNGTNSTKTKPTNEPSGSRQRKVKSAKDKDKQSTGDDDYKVIKRSPSTKEVALKWYNRGSNVFKGGLVRAALVFGNFIAAWRTVVETGNPNQYYWPGWCSVLMLAEFGLVVYMRKGKEWKWWSPCFIIYLGSTLPLVWQLQLQEHYSYVKELDAQKAPITSVNEVTNRTATNVSATTIAASGTTPTTAETPSETLTVSDLDVNKLMALGNDVWVIIVNESLLYFLVIARWFLPRGKMQRNDLSDMLLEYLGMASDIMELLAIFDEGTIRGNLSVNYWILSIWSLSFIQFIPLLKQKNEYIHIDNNRMPCIHKNCGENLAEIVSTFMSVFLQDGPFLVLRLYVMISLKLITYSLMFFVLKNIFTLFLLFYKLFNLFHTLPYLERRRSQLYDVADA